MFCKNKWNFYTISSQISSNCDYDYDLRFILTHNVNLVIYKIINFNENSNFSNSGKMPEKPTQPKIFFHELFVTKYFLNLNEVFRSSRKDFCD